MKSEASRELQFKTLQEVPDEWLLRPRHIYMYGISPEQLRKARRDGTLRVIGGSNHEHPFYPAIEVKRYFLPPIKITKTYDLLQATRMSRKKNSRKKSPELPTILPPLLRLRDAIRATGLTRDRMEALCCDRRITPFYKETGDNKNRRSKAWYRTWQFNRLVDADQLRDGRDGRALLGDHLKIQPLPCKRWLRRKDVLRWLRVTPAEIESWVRLGTIKRRRRTQAWGYFDRDEVMQKVIQRLDS